MLELGVLCWSFCWVLQQASLEGFGMVLLLGFAAAGICAGQECEVATSAALLGVCYLCDGY
jgi:hypothetical protein